jgi:hypothetical protein
MAVSSRFGLIAIQAVGALSLLPYPFIILASVMSIAAPGQTVLGALPYIFLSAYPAIFIGLYVLAWRALAGGAVGTAFALSMVPIACYACGAVFYIFGSRLEGFSKADGEARAQVEPINPVLWKVRCAGGHQTGGPVVSVDDAVKEIDKYPALVNLPVPPYGTPLKAALLNLSIGTDGTLSSKQADLVRLVRFLVAHGAQLSIDERSDLWRSWQLRRALFEGPVTTESENPLVWRILKRDTSSREPFVITTEELALVNQPTRIHGTPMYAVLLTKDVYIFPELVRAGARLSAEEESDPAAAKSLEEMFERRPESRGMYGR